MPKTRKQPVSHPKYGLILWWANDGLSNPKTDWPGIPISQIPLSATPELNLALADGVVRRVERPSKVWEGKKSVYVAPA